MWLQIHQVPPQFFTVFHLCCNITPLLIKPALKFCIYVLTSFTTEPDTPLNPTVPHQNNILVKNTITMPPQCTSGPSNEAQLLLAIQAIKNGTIQSNQEAQWQFDVDHHQVAVWRNRTPAQRDCLANGWNFDTTEEQALIDRILELDLWGFPPMKRMICTMANTLCEQRRNKPVGKNWVDRFIKCIPVIKSAWSWSYNHQRALQEDPKVIGVWFDLVARTKVKYGIQDGDTYNFDESGFMMGIIGSQLVVMALERCCKPVFV